MNKDVIDHLVTLKHNPIRNYILPGLTSWMLLDNVISRVRMFEMERNQHGFITPHSHRFDFSCCVLEGQVTNTLWYETNEYERYKGDLYKLCHQLYEDKPGEYTKKSMCDKYFYSRDQIYNPGEWYSMKHDQIHSIKFKRGSKVLFFEGVTVSKLSKYIEPISEGYQIPTLTKEDWMFVNDSK